MSVLLLASQLNWQGWWTMLLLILLFVAFVWERFPADVTAIVGAGLMVMTGVISSGQFVRSFTQPIIPILAILFAMARALEFNGVLKLVATRALPQGEGYRRQLAALLIPMSAFSAFLNNTPIVLMMVPVVRKWTVDHGRVLSKFLIPLSYAVILGGSCTLIGTSTNLVVQGALRQTDPTAMFSFFELGKVGLPCTLLGLLYLIFLAPALIPVRADPAAALSRAELTADFQVEEAVGQLKLATQSPKLTEVVIAPTSPLLGKTARKVNFRDEYDTTLLTIYREGERVEGDAADIPFHPGDRLLLLGEHHYSKELYFGNDFYVIRHEEELPLFRPFRALCSVAALTGMIVAVALGVPMVLATLVALMALLATKAITLRQAFRSIEWNLLLLIGSAFAMGQGLVASGVADWVANWLLLLTGSNPFLLVGGCFLMTMMVTEIVTNNATALIIFPIAYQLFSLAGYESVNATKAVGVTIALAASYSFLTPIGYQTNTIVYGPGGYRFSDYIRVGLPISLIVWVTATLLIPLFWPF